MMTFDNKCYFIKSIIFNLIKSKLIKFLAASFFQSMHNPSSNSFKNNESNI